MSLAVHEDMRVRRIDLTHANSRFYVNLLADIGAWSRLTAESAQNLIDNMEQDIPHDQLPPVYDDLVRERDRLKGMNVAIKSYNRQAWDAMANAHGLKVPASASQPGTIKAVDSQPARMFSLPTSAQFERLMALLSLSEEERMFVRAALADKQDEGFWFVLADYVRDRQGGDHERAAQKFEQVGAEKQAGVV